MRKVAFDKFQKLNSQDSHTSSKVMNCFVAVEFPKLRRFQVSSHCLPILNGVCNFGQDLRCNRSERARGARS